MRRLVLVLAMLALALSANGCSGFKKTSGEALNLIEERRMKDLDDEAVDSPLWVVAAKPVAATGVGDDFKVYGWLHERSFDLELGMPVGAARTRHGFTAEFDFVDKDVTGPSEWKLAKLTVSEDGEDFREGLPEKVAERFARPESDDTPNERLLEIARNVLEPVVAEKRWWTDLAVPLGADEPHGHDAAVMRGMSLSDAVGDVELAQRSGTPVRMHRPTETIPAVEDGRLVYGAWEVTGLGRLVPWDPVLIELDKLVGESETPTSSLMKTRKVGETPVLVFDAVTDRDTFGDGEDSGVHIVMDMESGRVLFAVPYGPLAFPKDRE